MTTQLWDLKLGAYITVPGELQDYFPQLPKVAHYCTGCGTEVPATVRPGPQWCAACDNPAVKARVRHRARMAVQKAAQVDGPVPPATVRAIINSGPCAYCGAEATTSTTSGRSFRVVRTWPTTSSPLAFAATAASMGGC